MRGTTGPWFASRTMIFMMLALTLVVSVVVYQQVIGREDAIPGSAGGYDDPQDRGVQVTDDVIAAFAGAAAVGDYATVQGYLEDNPMLYGIWKDQHDGFQEQIVGYHIVSRDTVGQTTTAVVRYDVASNYATCITLTLNEQTQRIWIDRGYAQCAAQP